MRRFLTLFCIFAIFGFVLSSAPSCRTRYELYRKWADPDNSQVYFECVQWATPLERECPANSRFSYPHQACLDLSSWIDLPYVPPPTSADNYEDECSVEILCYGGEVIDGVCECPPGFYLDYGICKIDIGNPDPGNNICEGASEEAYLPGDMDCEPIECTSEQYFAETLYPTRNPMTFWQCANVGWIEEMPCGPATCFDFKRQVCVHARDWKNHCM